ncbi:chaplin family protein [Streptomyces sp. NPDC004732]|uniref:chaplin n=1 Tax=Streptomyces sp. NPDC004732 TaxID=3154290 RepID=UPI0033B8F2CF
MRQALSKGMLSAAAATSILSLSGGHAFAAGEANGEALDSPGFLSGNSVQAPLEVPVNVCGNSANVAAVGNPATGNSCGSSSHSHSGPETAPEVRSAPKAAPPVAEDDATDSTDSSGPATGASAVGDASHSPGVLAGNNAKAPVDAPVNACGNAVGVVALLSGTTGNHCDSDAPHQAPPVTTAPPTDPAPQGPDPRPRAMPPAHPDGPRHAKVPSQAAPHHGPHGSRAPRPVHVDMARGELAATGSDDKLLGAAGASAALLLGGAILYRRGMASSRR